MEEKDFLPLEVQDSSYTVVREGQAEVLFPGSHDVFYNPVQEFNRDLSIAVLRLFAREHFDKVREKKKQKEKVNRPTGECSKEEMDTEEKNGDDEKTEITLEKGCHYEDGIMILEALAASGLRSIRYAKEVPGIQQIIANDYSHAAVESIHRNIAHNKVEHLVTASESDASLLMYQHRRHDDRFHAIDLDPYGSPTHFLDSAVQAVKEGGILMVTCTDMAVLAGNSPETCYVKYGAISLKSKACHEMALRIVLQCLESHANRYGRYIVPLLSISVDFYVRLFVQVFSSQAMCKRTTSKLSMVYQCVGCESFTLQPLGQVHETGKMTKYSLGHGPPVSLHCEHCNHRHQMGGPIWTDRIHNKEFVSALIESLEDEWESDFQTVQRLRGILNMVQEELQDVPLYYVLERLSSIVKTQTMSMLQFRSALMNAGYRVSLSHACRTSVKTDAPNHLLWDVLRLWEKKNPVRRDKWPEGSTALTILNKEPLNEISFAIHPEANPHSREKGLVRFQPNPERNWGPGSRAKTSLFHNRMEEKRVKNQGKRSRPLSDSQSDEKDPELKVVKLDDD